MEILAAIAMLAFFIGVPIWFIKQFNDDCPNCGSKLEYNSYDGAECKQCGFYRKK